MISPLNTFTKGERLRKKQHLDALFQSNESFIEFPFRVVYCKIPTNDISPVKVLISVPKRRIKKAVDRNLLKRRTREAYRISKESLCQHIGNIGDTYAIGLVYVGNEILPYSTILKSVAVIIQELKSRL
ncbi:ribonuclease P protein component [Balneicella halophila]|uniref:Ribonuclease P protein component n=1 Tax=Balneicella halophila TaxID=1537566 RepID=A0A7L4UQ26_BALHA|nr:ribonuclease P protein component [Balneicella halophila]PVX51885.1 ribonuclease P protein component [Balneicella halophila]